jgi:hypothetical protein
MQHPFTCIVAGCTQSGKIVWVKSLLENAQKTISPPPQRIIWCYDQWQPSHFDMMRTMPGIEFNEGIPEYISTGPFLTYKLGGANATPVPPCASPRNHILPPQEKSLFPKFIQTNQRRLTNT